MYSLTVVFSVILLITVLRSGSLGFKNHSVKNYSILIVNFLRMTGLITTDYYYRLPVPLLPAWVIQKWCRAEITSAPWFHKSVNKKTVHFFKMKMYVWTVWFTKSYFGTLDTQRMYLHKGIYLFMFRGQIVVGWIFHCIVLVCHRLLF